MLYKIKNPRYNYLSRLLILPIFACIALGFSLRKVNQSESIDNLLSKPLTVVIDAGHGGNDPGASIDGIEEDQINLDLSKKIKQLNQDPKLNILLTRETKGVSVMALKDRLKFVKDNNADLFISIHVNASKNVDKNGIEALIPLDNQFNKLKNEKLGSLMIGALTKIHKTTNLLLTQKSYLLENSPCPTLLIECGYLTNNDDRFFLKDEKNLKHLALGVLNAIEQYASTETSSTIDNRPGDTSLPGYKNVRIGTKGDVKVTKSTYDQVKTFKGVVIIDNKIVDKPLDTYTDLPSAIKSITVLQESNPLDTNLVNEYGEKAKKGVLIIRTKDIVASNENNDIVFTQVEQRAQFPGGNTEWLNFLDKAIDFSTIEKNKAPEGSYTVIADFIVEINGKIANIKPLNDPGYGMASEATRVLKLSPLWIPGKQNGILVRSEQKQPIVFKISK